MFKFRKYACTGDGELEEHVFEVLLENDEHPNFCTVCGAPVGEVEAIPGTHSIGGSAIQQAVDGTYRMLEETSAARAAMVGQPNIKVTNLKDGLREGDVAAVPLPNNTVTGFMRDAGDRGIRYGFQSGQQAGVAHGVKRADLEPGKYTGPAHISLAAAQSREGMATAKQMVAAGQINKTARK